LNLGFYLAGFPGCLCGLALDSSQVDFTGGFTKCVKMFDSENDDFLVLATQRVELDLAKDRGMSDYYFGNLYLEVSDISNAQQDNSDRVFLLSLMS
jgi:hypothetical protein